MPFGQRFEPSVLSKAPLPRIRALAAPLIAAMALMTNVETAFAQPSAQDQLFEANTDRPGRDFRNFEILPTPPGSFPFSCSDHCNLDDRCQAWTFVKPAGPGRNGTCFLKEAIPGPVPNARCESGVRQRTFEPNTDRPGRDFANMQLLTADPRICGLKCGKDSRCRAWTYVRPGGRASGTMLPQESRSSGAIKRLLHVRLESFDHPLGSGYSNDARQRVRSLTSVGLTLRCGLGVRPRPAASAS